MLEQGSITDVSIDMSDEAADEIGSPSDLGEGRSQFIPEPTQATKVPVWQEHPLEMLPEQLNGV